MCLQELQEIGKVLKNILRLIGCFLQWLVSKCFCRLEDLNYQNDKDFEPGVPVGETIFRHGADEDVLDDGSPGLSNQSNLGCERSL